MEFALVLPFLAVLALGTVDLGRAYQMKNRLTNAAREGAFYGQFHPCDTTEIEEAAAGEDPGIGQLPGYTVTARVSGGSCPGSPSGDLEVVARSTLEVFTPFIGAITGDEVTVSGRATVAVQ